ncbi:MAG: type I restriction enzyme HsdR N-terminal domain-containing protein [Thermodesulfobacteriota bacterium]|nr:type I restriction enzyme HsdR N-terminal domain-containing protein [Thermodesulfobacteriota bacterium]
MGRDHLVLGETTDFITGKTVTDTHDERARQSIARLLVEEKGYEKTDIDTGVVLPVTVDGDTGRVRVDFVVRENSRAVMVVNFGPGDIVSRQRPTLAVARLLEKYVIPYAVITNSRDAYTMNVTTGKVTGKGLAEIPARQEIVSAMDGLRFDTLPEERADKEWRILFFMEVLAERECDDFTCKR